MPRNRVLLHLLILLFATSGLRAQTHPAGFDDQPVVSGLEQPTTLAMTPEGRLFIGLRGGVIRVVDQGGLLPAPMLTLPVETYEEQGLLGIALDPDYAVNRWLYVFWTPYTGSQPAPENRVSRFTVQADTVLAGSEVVVIAPLPTGAGYHVGGGLRTSSDGHLWLTIGDVSDGEFFGWPRMNDRLEGKLLRLNLDGSIPADNPLAGVPGARGEIWQKGLRSPFRFALQPGTLRPFVNDVGSYLWEEINRGDPGADFGWPDHEGAEQPAPADAVNPIFTYPHAGSGASITGAAFYTGGSFPPGYAGNYFFVDHSRGQIGRMVLAGDSVVSVTMPWGTTAGWGWGGGPVDLLMGGDGALYYTQYTGGQVRRITYGATADVNAAAATLAFARPWPNPARGGTTLAFTLAAPGHARLSILDVQGRSVRVLVDGALVAGAHSEDWDGRDAGGRAAPAGIYLARLETAGATLSRRIVRLR